jgi:peroxiredoxin
MAALAGLLACGGGGAERGTSEAPVSLAVHGGEHEAEEGIPQGSPSAAGEVPGSRDGLDRVGQPAPAWGELEWIGSEPLRLEDLRGRVVLIRFWTDACPFCRASAPALAEIDRDYRERGVTVIGMYHPKPRGSTRPAGEVAEVRDGFGWRFAVAIDAGWEVIDAFWLAHRPRDYTSASFVLDRRGVIRYVHPGPEYHPGGPPEHEACRRDYADVRAALEALLAEPLE